MAKSSASMVTTPYWTESTPFPGFPRLDADARADVVVVGGGITGLTTACLLASAGRSVILLERDCCAQHDSGHTSAHLTMVTDTRLPDLVARVGRTHAQAVWDAGLAAIAQVHALVETHGIACDFAWVDGYLHARTRESDATRLPATVQELQAEAALASDLGFDADFVGEVPLIGSPGIKFTGQARFHLRKYLAGLARAITSNGGRIYEHSAAETFEAEPLSIGVNGCTITCGDVVIATHSPLVGLGSGSSAALFQTKLALYTSYVVAARAGKGQVPDALFWDTDDPYTYLRLDPRDDHDVVIIGGQDHKTGQVSETRDGFARLEERLRALVSDVTLTHRWSGQVIETPDGLPFIGATANRQWSATGFSGNGMTFGTLGALMATDAILGRRNPWADLFAPDRGAIRRGLWDYIKENADYPYYMMRDRFAGGEGRSLRSVPRGQGGIIEHRGRKVAAYRDDQGAISLTSAICTHLGCVVAWNAAERTWDCPCHGSRFSPDGRIIAGPAESPLPRLDV